MKKTATAFGAVFLVAVTACGGPVQDRQQSADPLFGEAMMGLVVASGPVGICNLMPVCSAESLPQPVGRCDRASRSARSPTMARPHSA